MSQPRFFRSAAEFRKWLAANAAKETELVVGFRKVGTGQASLTWPESVDEALCVGWIDGVRKRIDDAAYQIRFTPRRKTSIWSAVNIARYEALVADGRMTDAGTAAFVARKESRSGVYAYEQPDTAELSAAETRTFKAADAAWKYFQSTPPGYRKVILHWITQARRPETRTARLAKLIAACGRGERLR